jgi:hypothetical protein
MLHRKVPLRIPKQTRWLLDNGFDIHADTSNGHEAVVRLLLEAKVDADAKEEEIWRDGTVPGG